MGCVSVLSIYSTFIYPCDMDMNMNMIDNRNMNMNIDISTNVIMNITWK
jgi:hypothetical protein